MTARDPKHNGAPAKIGVLALQGDVIEHVKMLRGLGVEAIEVRTPEDLAKVDALVIPGGESTTIGKLAVEYGLDRAIPARVKEGMPVYGTCAGMIALSKQASGGEPPLLRLMNITVRRNAYGRQVDSFETDLEIPALGGPPLHAVFIRAPAIENVGPDVEVLASLGGKPVLARQGNMLVSAFHPELTADDRVHRYFVEMLKKKR
ncbi:MAG TPA: pyridoxal 5'-phosphate synthase glutaminase subunit PdxT [bacterium]|nr:pyridoxal 5'-phosphate synthase glutaminase subunit PdxT [bacterium]